MCKNSLFNMVIIFGWNHRNLFKILWIMATLIDMIMIFDSNTISMSPIAKHLMIITKSYPWSPISQYHVESNPSICFLTYLTTFIDKTIIVRKSPIEKYIMLSTNLYPWPPFTKHCKESWPLYNFIQHILATFIDIIMIFDSNTTSMNPISKPSSFKLPFEWEF